MLYARLKTSVGQTDNTTVIICTVRRVLVAALGMMMVLTPTAARAVTLTDGDLWGQWQVVFAGYGSVTATGSGTSSKVTLAPAVATSPDQTHAALVVSRATLQDARLRARVALDDQLRENSPANPWESGWLVTRYQDPEHFYYVALKTNGWELGKRDPAYPGGQRFLATGSTPRTSVGTSRTVVLQAVGRKLSVKIDGSTVATFTDTERPYTDGALGFYCEDAVVTFSRITVTDL